MYRLAIHAFKAVLGRRQTKFRQFLAWLDEKSESLRAKQTEMVGRMRGIVATTIDREVRE